MKTLFRIFAILFIVNTINFLASFVLSIYETIGCFKTNNGFIGDLFIFSTIAILPLAFILIYLLSIPTKKKEIWM